MLPSFLGIYQLEEMIDVSEEEKKLFEENERTLLELFDFVYVPGVTDDIDPTLIHVSYDEKTWKREQVVFILDDILDRVALSPLEKCPNFYEKDVDTLRTLSQEFLNMNEQNMPLDKIIREFKSRFKSYVDRVSQFGITKRELQSILSLTWNEKGPIIPPTGIYKTTI